MSKTATGALLACIASSAWHPEVTAQVLEDLSPAVRDFVALEASHVHIRDVGVIDGAGTPIRRAMSVVIRDGRVERVAPSAEVGDVLGAAVVDGAGHTLMPGLVMLHEHLFYPSGALRYNTNEVSFPPLYLAGAGWACAEDPASRTPAAPAIFSLPPGPR